MNRIDLIAEIAKRIAGLNSSYPRKIAIDGIDASGKTTLANELAEFLQQAGHPTIRASIDGFHNPREIRYQRGPLSPEGYYFDAFDYPTLKKLLLDPLSENGDLHYQTAIFDFKENADIQATIEIAPQNAILLVDGVFLQRPDLVDYWDLKIFVEVSFEMALTRALKRDIVLFGNRETVMERYQKRYIPAQQLYLENCQPHLQADIVVKNNDPSNATLIFKSR
jgi:uridine kinase